MPTSYTVNGQPATEAQYNAAMASMPAMPAMPVPFGDRAVPGVPAGAERPAQISQPKIEVRDSKGTIKDSDSRVKIRVPPKYLTAVTSGETNEADGLLNHGGIIFPYTPSISFGVKADYSEQKPLHSNFSLHFYQRSSVGEIAISGKFSVENSTDAKVYIATIHLLKALTRMRSGGAGGGDPDSGAPPPVCRLDAYGPMMLKNIPVVITGFRIELPDNVDYFTSTASPHGQNSVPTLSTLAITCLPMYSRNEMQQFSVTGYINNELEGFI